MVNGEIISIEKKIHFDFMANCYWLRIGMILYVLQLFWIMLKLFSILEFMYVARNKAPTSNRYDVLTTTEARANRTDGFL